MDSPCTRCQPREVVQYEDPSDYVKMQLTAFPLHFPAPVIPASGIPEKWLKLMASYKCSWRIGELAKSMPRRTRKKFGWKPPPIPEEEQKPVRKKKADPEIQFYTDQMSRPALRMLMINKKLYAKILDAKHRKRLKRTCAEAWDSIYNYYKKRERDRYLRMLRIQKRQKKEKYVFKRTAELAKPRPIYKPKPKKPKKKKRTFKQCTECKVNLAQLSMPIKRPELPVNKPGAVKKAALRYIITKETLALTKPWPRFKNILPPLPLGKVKRAALLYQITERTEQLSVPRKRTDAGGGDDDDWNPFAISKFALKARATKRTIELAKPRQRD